MRRPLYSSKLVYHIYNRGNRKKKIFYSIHDYERLLMLVERYSHLCQIHVGILCLMPNHFHMVVSPLVEGDISNFMQRIGIAYTMYVNKRYGLVGHVFQGNYQVKTIPGVRDLERLKVYIQRNPVKDGLVSSWYHYRWIQFRSDILQAFKDQLVVAKKGSTG